MMSIPAHEVGSSSQRRFTSYEALCLVDQYISTTEYMLHECEAISENDNPWVFVVLHNILDRVAFHYYGCPGTGRFIRTFFPLQYIESGRFTPELLGESLLSLSKNYSCFNSVEVRRQYGVGKRSFILKARYAGEEQKHVSLILFEEDSVYILYGDKLVEDAILAIREYKNRLISDITGSEYMDPIISQIGRWLVEKIRG